MRPESLTQSGGSKHVIKTKSVRVYRGVLLALLLIGASVAVAGAQGLSPNPSPPLAPEIDAGTMGGAVAMLVCGALMFLARGQSAKVRSRQSA